MSRSTLDTFTLDLDSPDFPKNLALAFPSFFNVVAENSNGPAMPAIEPLQRPAPDGEVKSPKANNANPSAGARKGLLTNAEMTFRGRRNLSSSFGDDPVSRRDQAVEVLEAIGGLDDPDLLEDAINKMYTVIVASKGVVIENERVDPIVSHLSSQFDAATVVSPPPLSCQSLSLKRHPSAPL